MNQDSQLNYQYTISEGDCNIIQLYAIKVNPFQYVLTIFATLCTGFMFLLTLHWSKTWKRKCLYDFCSRENATHYFILNWDREWSIAAKVPLDQGLNSGESGFGFRNRHQTFYYNQTNNFFSCAEIDCEKFIIQNDFNLKQMGVDQTNKEGGSELERQRNWFGQCVVNVPIPGYINLFVLEVLHPFFVFNCYSSALWIYQEYIIFAIFIFGFSSLSSILNLILIRINLVQIHHMAYRVSRVHVMRKEKEIVEISSSDLVPGDILFLKEDSSVPCDGILLDGNILINEASLTGESVPVLKTQFDTNVLYNEKIHKNSSVYEGTDIIQITNLTFRGGYVIPQDQGQMVPIYVVRTGFSTTRGTLIRSILYPKPHTFTFFQESLKFIFILFLFSVIGYCILINRFLETLTPEDMVIKFLDLFTITVPPTLPASLHVGITYSVYRLEQKNIFCISPPKTVVGGRVKTVNFDKTGTLTEDGMDLVGVYPVSNGVFYQGGLIEKDRKNDGDLKEKPDFTKMIEIMSSCHTLSRLEKKFKENDNASIIGDTMELRMFEFSYSDLPIFNDPSVIFIAKTFEDREKKGGSTELRIVKRFDFTSELQRMSVLVEIKDKTFIFLKGAPEVVQQLCNKGVPADFLVQNDDNAQKGFRNLALAYKQINEKIDFNKPYNRQNYEIDLTFVGLVVFDNPVKPNTKATLQKLRDAEINMQIVTGDNALTALAVARQCSLIDMSADVLLIDFDVRAKKMSIQRQMADASEIQLMKTAESHTGVHEKKVIDGDTQEPLNKEPMAAPASLAIEMNKLGNNNMVQVANQKDYPPHIQNFVEELKKFDNQIFAVTGNAFQELYINIEPSSEMLAMLKLGKIFARMKPNHKAVLVELLQHQGEIVAMVGDGANDVGALKQADIGLALSTAEASISAPFTARDLDIASIHKLLLECRSGLAASFSMFKFMASYSMLQFTSTIICYWFYAFFSNNFYLYQDANMVTPLFIVMANTYAEEKLSKNRPKEKLLNAQSLLSIFGFGVIQAIAQIATIFILSNTSNLTYGEPFLPEEETIQTHQEFYKENEEMDDCTTQGTSLFLVSLYFYLAASYIMSVTTPFRQSQYTNLPYLFVLIVLYVHSIILSKDPAAFYADFEDEEKLQYEHMIKSDYSSELIGWGHFWLLYEGKILQTLQGGIGIPVMHWCGQQGDFNFLVMELLGQNLEELLTICNRRFSLQTVLMLMDQILTNIEYLHFKGLIHRDIKPENFVMGLGKKCRNVYMIDFGIAKKYRDQRSLEHIPFRDQQSLSGTARYASLNSHRGYELSRRDDLEAVGYMMIYFFRGELPWQGLKAENKDDKYQKIFMQKENTNLQELCEGLPVEILQYMSYVKNLKFEEKPDYTYLKKILRERFVQEGYEFDYIYDWILIPLSSRFNNISSQIPVNIEMLQNEADVIKDFDNISEISMKNYYENVSNNDIQDDKQNFYDDSPTLPQQNEGQQDVGNQNSNQDKNNNVGQTQEDDQQKNNKGDCMIF